MSQPSSAIVCRWCFQPAINSHLTPQTILRTFSKIVYPPKLRHLSKPNVVRERLGTVPLLCKGHDGSFSNEENKFVQRVYGPLLKRQRQFQYDDWLIKFAIFLAWKRLITGLQKLNDLSYWQISEANKALSHWEGYLLGKHQDIGYYQHHLLLTWFYAKEPSTPEAHRRILLDTFDSTIVPLPEGLLIVTAFPGCMLMSLAAPWSLGCWDTTKISIKGTFDDSQELPSAYLLAWVIDSIQYGIKQAQNISQQQRAIIKTYTEELRYKELL